MDQRLLDVLDACGVLKEGALEEILLENESPYFPPSGHPSWARLIISGLLPGERLAVFFERNDGTLETIANFRVEDTSVFEYRISPHDRRKIIIRKRKASMLPFAYEIEAGPKKKGDEIKVVTLSVEDKIYNMNDLIV